ncbi:glycosyl hydrolase family 8 [Lacimicrobium alkaliphilum]|uniref:cellulase n=1 Tax=Lacimicrobium alkaliphilum TaxID=1526571 RepID=A0A0U2ZNP0_9ALTE|nr:glycosyl hydrolase family 8 [Lacimicrobium alkaliphilum]ALS99884.1 glycoside hydrolase [Lacimicrobium alkaliphilum]
MTSNPLQFICSALLRLTGSIALLVLLSSCANKPSTEAETLTTAGAISGNYPNLFAGAGYSQADIDNKIASAFTQLFYGDRDTQRVYYQDGHNSHGPKAYIEDINNQDVRSEGMSYGMMIAVQLDKQQEFNALWNWAVSHTYQDDPSHPAYGYFAWSVRPDGTIIDPMPAPDGEEYFATALYFASVRWGDGEGIFNYQAQADNLLTHMRHREIITGTTIKGQQSATNLFHPEYAMVRFTPDLAHSEHTDASYHLPAFYEVWARVGPKADRAFWKRAAHASRDYFSLAAHPKTGLTPDYGNFDGSPWAAPWRPESKDFRFDAWRTAMNWSFDWSWWRQDPRARQLSDRLQAFFASEGLDNYVSQYSLDGKKLDNAQTTGLVAMNAVASLAATRPVAEDFVHALWQQSIPAGRHRYYDGMLYMMALLHVSGQYQAWLPTQLNEQQP